MARSLQMTLVGQGFIVMVVVVDLMKPAVGPKAFMTDEAFDIPPCEKITDIVRL